MKTLYLECAMGAAGDMLTAALLELTEDREAILEKLNSLGLPGVTFTAEPAEKCGITGTHMRVTVHGEEEHSHDHHEQEYEHHDHEHHDHEHHHEHHEHHDHGHHHHASMVDIRQWIEGMAVSEKVKENALAVYRSIAEAESKVHGKPVEEIHFHEVGSLDAVADVTAVCLLMEALAPEQVVVSPVHVGSGQVHCAHGILPVPAPATALLLQGIPSYGGSIKGELCTPTGAALLRRFGSKFGDMPVMMVEKIGYGMGSKDFEAANCVRAFLGESAGGREEITRLECNLDDMTGEDIGFVLERLMEAGARDVYTQAVGMKKSRPGILLSCVCMPQDADRLAGIMLRHTTTLGVRRQDMSRYYLARSIERLETPYGSVRVKTARGMGVEKSKAEYDDLKEIALKENLSLRELRDKIQKIIYEIYFRPI